MAEIRRWRSLRDLALQLDIFKNSLATICLWMHQLNYGGLERGSAAGTIIMDYYYSDACTEEDLLQHILTTYANARDRILHAAKRPKSAKNFHLTRNF